MVAPASRAHALLQLGHLAYWTTRFPLAAKALTEARGLLDHGSEPVLLGQVLRRLGAVAAATDEVRRAEGLLAESVAVLADAGAETEEAVSLLHLGSLLADENRTAEAVRLLVRARDALRAAGDPLREAQVLAALMLAWWKAGDAAAALGAGQRARAALATVGHRPTEGVVGYRLAAVCRALGRSADARAYADDALADGQATGTRSTSALARLTLARLDLDAGAVDEAARQVAAALEGLDVRTDRWVLADALEVTARLQVERGEPAGWLLERAARLRAEIGQPPAPTDAAELALLADRVAAQHRGRPPRPGPGSAAADVAASTIAGPRAVGGADGGAGIWPGTAGAVSAAARKAGLGDPAGDGCSGDGWSGEDWARDDWAAVRERALGCCWAVGEPAVDPAGRPPKQPAGR